MANHTRRSILRKSATAVAATTGVVGLSGTAAAYHTGDYELGIAWSADETSSDLADYKIEVPKTGDGTTVEGTAFNEPSEPDKATDKGDHWVVLGTVSAATSGDIYNVHNGDEPNVLLEQPGATIYTKKNNDIKYR